MLLEISERYLKPEKVPAYIEFAEAELGASRPRSTCAPGAMADGGSRSGLT